MFNKRAGFKPDKIKKALQSRVDKNLELLRKRNPSGLAAQIGLRESAKAMSMSSKNAIRSKDDLDWAKMTLKNLGQKNLGRITPPFDR